MFSSHLSLATYKGCEDRSPAMTFSLDFLKTNKKNKIKALDMPNEDAIAKELGFKKTEDALSQAEVLLNRIAAGFLPSKWEETCIAQHSISMCEALKSYFQNFELDKAEESAIKARRVYYSLTEKKIPEIQKSELSNLYKQKWSWNKSKLDKFTKTALNYKQCPRNFSLYLARKTEEFGLGSENLNVVATLDAHGFECGKEGVVFGESVLLRAAMIRILLKKYEEAIALLDQASLIEKTKENTRVLYWKYWAQEKLGKMPEAQTTLKALYNKNPISWYSVIAKMDHGIDPLDALKNKEKIQELMYPAKDHPMNIHMKWLYLAGHFAQKEPYAFMKYADFVINRIDGKDNIGIFQYLAKFFNSLEMYRSQIIAINKIISLNSDLLNEDHLILLYPNAFLDLVKKHSSKFDYAIILGLMRQESTFNVWAQSSADAYGLMQLILPTARSMKKRVKKEELLKPDLNIELGSKFLFRLWQRTDESIEKSFASYNAGFGNLKKWEASYPVADDLQLFVDLIPYLETRDYVSSILRNAFWYHRLNPDFTKRLLNETVVSSDLLRLHLKALQKQ